MKVFRDWTWRLAPLALIALLLAPATPAAAQDFPYTGIVVEDNAEVRSGAARAYYVVGELDSGDVVEVEEVIFGWLKIVPPEGVHSYISKAFVDAHGDGQTGEVNANRTRVTAASVDGPGNSYREQTLLNTGATVNIVAEEGSFYKIESPANTFVFLPPGSVRRASDMEAATEPADEPDATPSQPAQPSDGAADADTDDEDGTDAGAQPDVSTTAEEASGDAVDAGSDASDDEQPQPAAASANATDAERAGSTPDATADASTEAGSEAPADADPTRTTQVDAGEEADDEDDAERQANAAAQQTDDGEGAGDAPEPAMAEGSVEEVDTPAVSDALRDVEQRHLPAFNLPLEEQPIDRMIADYEAVLEQRDLPNVDRRIAEHRLTVLERNQQIAATLTRLADLRDQAEQTDRELAERQEARDSQPPNYDAVGELLASTVYDGQSLPQLFRLVDPATGRTIGYVEPTETITPSRMLGRVVGVVGDRRLDANLRLRVFDVRRIDVLESSAVEAD